MGLFCHLPHAIFPTLWNTRRPQSQLSSIRNLTRFIYELGIKYAGRGETLSLFLESVCKGKAFRNSTKMYLAFLLTENGDLWRKDFFSFLIWSKRTQVKLRLGAMFTGLDWHFLLLFNLCLESILICDFETFVLIAEGRMCGGRTWFPLHSSIPINVQEDPQDMAIPSVLGVLGDSEILIWLPYCS